MPPAPPSYEKIVLGFGAVLAVLAYAYWTSISFARGEGWTSVAASRALVVLGASVVLSLVLRFAAALNRS